jgi:hypothetical protein
MELLLANNDKQESRTHNSTFAIGGVSRSTDSLVVAANSVSN